MTRLLETAVAPMEVIAVRDYAADGDAAVETAMVAADALRKHHKLHVGVVGIQSLRPFPNKALREALASQVSQVKICTGGGVSSPRSNQPMGPLST